MIASPASPTRKGSTYCTTSRSSSEKRNGTSSSLTYVLLPLLPPVTTSACSNALHLAQYFRTFKQKSLDTSEFTLCLFAFFAPDSAATGLLHTVDFNHWYYAPGLPPKPDFDTSLVDVCYALADKWASLSSSPSSFTPQKSDIDGLSANQLVVFLSRILSSPPEASLSAQNAEAMDRVYGLASSQNVEISSRYFQVGLKARYTGVEEPTAALLGKVGRIKFVRPLYRALEGVNRELAIKTYRANETFYHPICRGMVEKDLFGGGGEKK